MLILNNLYVILILRVLHVAGGIVWVGSAALYLLMLVPVARITQSAGQKFLQTLAPRLGATLGIVATVTVLSGALLYARFFAGGISFIWTTGAGAAFTVGASRRSARTRWAWASSARCTRRSENSKRRSAPRRASRIQPRSRK